MKKMIILPIIMGLSLFASFPSPVKADGKDIAVTGKVVSAIIDDKTGKVYELLPEEKGKPLPSSIRTGETVSVFGDQLYKKGHFAIRVEKVK